MEFRALNAPSLTEEVATKLETYLNNLPGVKRFTVSVETRQFYIIFDETKLSFNTVAQAMAKSGCPIQSISAALFKE